MVGVKGPVRCAQTDMRRMLSLLARAAAATALLVARVHGAALLQDHTVAWTAAGLAEAPVQAYADALPPALFEAVSRDAAAVAKEGMGSQDKFGKKTTWWLPLRDRKHRVLKPRSAIEAAIHHLFQRDFGAGDAEAHRSIAGAEWWIQEQASHDDIGFHYDKDEAFATEQMTMKFPEVSTVTYLQAHGAPTLVLNQTTPDGNLEIPETPTEGWLCYPQRNKHLLFRGNLQHGVSGRLSRAPRSGTLGSRRTLLINWWREAPLPPNCKAFDGWARHRQQLSNAQLAALLAADQADGGGGGGSEGAGGGGAAPDAGAGAEASPLVAGRREWTPMAFDDAATKVQFTVEIPPTDLFFFDALAPAHQPAHVHDWVVRWRGRDDGGSGGGGGGAGAAAGGGGAAGAVLGPIARLDLEHRSSTSSLFREKRPKLVFVLADTAGERWRGRLPRWLRALHAEHADRFKFVLADPARTADFMRAFGISASDAPTAVIHDTAAPGGDAKHKLGEQMSKAAVRRFIARFLQSKKQEQEQGSPRTGKDEV